MDLVDFCKQYKNLPLLQEACQQAIEYYKQVNTFTGLPAFMRQRYIGKMRYRNKMVDTEFSLGCLEIPGDMVKIGAYLIYTDDMGLPILGDGIEHEFDINRLRVLNLFLEFFGDKSKSNTQMEFGL